MMIISIVSGLILISNVPIILLQMLYLRFYPYTTSAMVGQLRDSLLECRQNLLTSEEEMQHKLHELAELVWYGMVWYVGVIPYK